MENAQQMIEAENQKFTTAFKQGDAAGIAALYTSDARLLPPNAPAMGGTDQIRNFWQGAMSLGIKEAKLETVEVETRGDLAVENGRYTLLIQPEGAESFTDTGKYVVVWKNEGGTWKLHIDIWNTSRPA